MDETESRKCVQENGISFIVPEDKRRAELLKFYNSKLSLFREIVLASLSVEGETCGAPLFCLEADTGSGVASLQWKKHLGEAVQVVVAEKRPDQEVFGASCRKNGLTCAPWTLDPDRTPGELSKLEHQKDFVYLSPFSARVTLHSEAFNFVFIQPNNSITSYVDAVFANLRHNGVACFLSPNIASQCFRCPKLIQRLYQAHVLKTEYVKEMAARLVIGDIVRSASQRCRGVEVLYTVCFEDHFLIAVRVLKKNQTAIECAEQIRTVLHCLMCEERVVYPDVHSPIEHPYTLLPCDCKERHPGKTAVIIGPMWTGEIFSPAYLRKIVDKSKVLFTKSKTPSVLESILTEAICSSTNSEEKKKNTNSVSEKSLVKSTGNSEKELTSTNGKESHATDQACGDASEGSVKDLRTKDAEESGEPAEKKRKLEVNDAGIKSEVGTDKGLNDKQGSGSESNTEKRLKDVQGNSEGFELENAQQSGPTPLFYRNLHKKKYSGTPKIDELVKFLRQEGYRASRSHFEEHSIRSNATGKQVEEAIAKFSAH